MKKGKALMNGYSGIPDFPGDLNACTLSSDPSIVSMVSCWKCPSCGKSITAAKPIVKKL